MSYKELYKLSLYEFFKYLWPAIEGSKPFIDGKHTLAVAKHLEACFYRRIKRLLLNIPPRTGKTSLISIIYPLWCWLHNPEEKFMYASYANSLSLEHSLKCRRAFDSVLFQKMYGALFTLAQDQNAKGYFENSKGGYRIATSVGSSATGRGGSILVLDDPNSVTDGISEVNRATTNSWFDQVWSTRLNDPKRDVMIVVQQRIHEKDISGHIMSSDEIGQWTKLILPMEFEISRKSETYIDDKLFWQDWRTTEGELLSENRITSQELTNFKHTLGSYGYAGQYQQRPSPLGGGIIKKDWFKKWTRATYPKFHLIIQSWDTAISDQPTAAYSACTTWGVWKDPEDKLKKVILLSSWRGRVDYPALRERAKRLHNNYLDIGSAKNDRFLPVDKVLIEAKATGDPLIRDLRLASIPAIGYLPKGDKHSRVQRISHFIEAGFVWLPTFKDNPDRFLNFADEFVEEAASFPNASSRDLVDSMTQCLQYIVDSKVLYPGER